MGQPPLPPWPWALAGGSGFPYLLEQASPLASFLSCFLSALFLLLRTQYQMASILCEEITIRNMPDPLCPSSLVSQGTGTGICKERPVPQTQPLLSEHLVRLGSCHPISPPGPTMSPLAGAGPAQRSGEERVSCWI